MSVSYGSIEVVIADQSSHTRLVLDAMLSGQEDICVTGFATEGNELIQVLKKRAPHVVLINSELPDNTRLFTFKRIFSEVPTPILMLVKHEQLTLELVKEATALGVYGVLIKPDKKQLPDFRLMTDELIHKVRSVRQTINWDVQQRFKQLQKTVVHLRHHSFTANPLIDTVVVIGASTGGIQALETIVRELKPNLNASILAAVHMPAGFSKSFAQRMQQLTTLTVREGRHGLMLRPRKIIVAPGGRNMMVQPIIGNDINYKVAFSDEGTIANETPSIDMLMHSVANSKIKNVLAVILTGLGKDGTEGGKAIYARGGTVIAQDQASSAIFGMAKSAINNGITHYVLPLSEIPQFINCFVEEKDTVSLSDDIV
jgi:two-component system, chemotaxis family, protein-glutamate methylesterase/glutaminase